MTKKKDQESEPKKFIHSERINQATIFSLNSRGTDLVQIQLRPFLFIPPLFYRCLSLSLSLSAGLSSLSSLKSDYSSSQCDRDPHEALHH